MRILIVVLALFSCNVSLGKGISDKTKIEKGARVLVDGLDKWYNMETGQWETTSWWNAANVLTALIKYGSYSGDLSVTEIIENTFEKTKEFEVEAQDGKDAWICKNYINEYYDDEGWWALAWLDAWEYTGDVQYLEMARIIFEDITTAWNEECDGGMYWKKGFKYKGTISNSLALTLATRLHLAKTGEVNGRTCLQWSVDIWQWMMDLDLLNNLGLLQDGIKNKDGNCDVVKAVWTYNQGVVLTGLVNLHSLTGEKQYLESAHSLAKAAIVNMVSENGILKEINCEPNDCNSDAEQFKGIFMRHLRVLDEYSPKREYSQFMNENVTSILNNSMNNGNRLPGVSWSLPSEKTTAATVSSALDAFNAVLMGEI